MVNTSDSTPQSMGRIATCQTMCEMSYMDTVPEVVSMFWKSAPRMPL